ncbi:hypothetical protein [Ferrimonas balearica]|uniref:hypothetical protein n=1 Tax=Ferrimonas balearica TaxID=44012 RepID=UPI001C993506|nr:hypothetical protein [Ferrimonas balearica]MBY5991141.1 hypothetical protein [Ferrimonas balearica]
MFRTISTLALLLFITACDSDDNGGVTVIEPDVIDRKAQTRSFNFLEGPNAQSPVSYIDFKAFVDNESAEQLLGTNLLYEDSTAGQLSWSQIVTSNTTPEPEPVPVRYQVLDTNDQSVLAETEQSIESDQEYWLIANGVINNNAILQQFEVVRPALDSDQVSLRFYQGDGRNPSRRIDVYIDQELQVSNIAWSEMSQTLSLPATVINSDVDIVESGTTPNFSDPSGHLWHSNSLDLGSGTHHLLVFFNDLSGRSSLYVFGF